MSTIEFEWQISNPMPDGEVYVRERLVGTDKFMIHGPMPKTAADPFIKARRAWVYRTITTHNQAIAVFEPPQRTIH